MTSAECIYTVRMLIDDGRDWFPTTTFLVEAINYAQYRTIHELFKQGDERGLRPLYRESDWLQTTDVVYRFIGSEYLSCLYPRGLKVMADPTVVIGGVTDPITGSMITANAKYLDNNNYFNYFPQDFDLPQSFPSNLYYTITYDYDAAAAKQVSYIRFTQPNDTVQRDYAKLVYIEEPRTFTYTAAPPTDVTLSLPNEYHYTVCSDAAEMVNTLDVGELERSMVAFQNQKLTYSNIAEIQ